MDYYKLLNMSAQLGRQLMLSGAEIYRVEESVSRLLTAYGLEPQVMAIPNCLIVSITPPNEQPITQMYRISSHGTDLELLEACNALCRRMCREQPPVEEAQAMVDALSRQCRTFSPRIKLLGYAMAAAFFALFFGGTFRDCLCAGLDGLAVGVCLLFGRRIIGSNSFFRTVICSGVAAFMALLLVYLGFGQNTDAITIATLMVLVPGMALTNAMREIMAGDIISGVNRTAETLLIATAIALGTALPLLLEQGMIFGPTASPVTDAFFLPCLWSFLACVGFGLIFNVQGVGILICGFGGALGWLVYLIAVNWSASDIFCAFLSAMSISAYSELMARIRRCPATGYLLIALLPLVPGAGIYYTMRHCISGNTDLFLSTLLHTVGFAAAISVGAMLVSSVLRVFLSRLYHARSS